MAGTRPGRDPKGDRAQITLRVPRTHRDVYEREAKQAGLPLCDYLALRLARAQGLEDPDYITAQLGDEALLLDA